MQDNKLKVLYLTWGEPVWSSGIFKNLICEQLKSISKDKRAELFVLCGIPVFSINFFINRTKAKNNIYSLMTELKEHGILFSVFYLFLPFSWFSRFYFLPILHVPYLLFLSSYIKRNNIKVINCRSYHAATAALLCKRIFTPKIKVVFDTRGNFPEEAVVSGKFKENSFSFIVWKKIEKWLFKNADAIVNISEEFNSYIRTINNDQTPCYAICASINLEPFFSLIDKNELRSKNDLDKSFVILTYMGDLSKRGYHRIEIIGDVYKSFKKIFGSRARLLIISKSDKRYIRDFLNDFDRSLVDDLIIKEANSIIETSMFLKMSDYSVFPYRETSSESELIMSSVMIGSKIPEYLAAGLPVISNRDVTAVTNMIKRNNLGITFNIKDLSKLSLEISELNKSYDLISSNCLNYATKTFDVNVSARKYLEVFFSL